MFVTLSGMVKLSKELHPRKASIPIIVKPSGTFMLVKEEQ
jgi:hypothetical protein